jgi:hypothetical protein
LNIERPNKPPPIPEEDKKLWRKLRDQLFSHVTHYKCAYCETKVVRDTGDTEHYRPKGRVSFKAMDSNNAEIVEVTAPDGSQIRHPGYFWLAFCWENLLPSCKRCNAILGKGSQFPIRQTKHIFLHKHTEDSQLGDDSIESSFWPGWYYLSSSALDALEDPMLLHPYNDNPRNHLLFLESGLIVSRPGGDVEKANHSIQVFDLNDELLRLERQKQQRLARQVYLARVGMLQKDGNSLEDSYEKAYRGEELLSEDAVYSAAAMDAVWECIPETYRKTCL